MKKRIIAFRFNENSITKLDEADIESIITIPDGHVIVLPRLEGAIECAPNTVSSGLAGMHSTKIKYSKPASRSH
jgi:hypothetical protein